MSKRSELNSYIRRLQQRLRLGASLRGIAVLTATALATTVVLVLILNKFAFPERSLFGVRTVLLLILIATAGFGLAIPLLRLTRRRSIATAETAQPEFQQRLLTFHERDREGNDPFIELLAADTLAVTHGAAPTTLVTNNKLFALAGAGVASLGVLLWMIAAGPGYLGYGAALLWMGPKPHTAPLYDIHVAPGDVAVRRNSDQLITASIIGLKPDTVRLFAHYHSARDGSWESVNMQSRPANGAGTYQFLLAGLPEDVEYYVEAGPLTSPHYKVRVVDLPAVKDIQVTYHYPRWTGMKQVTEEHSGDLRAIEGTDADIEVFMDHPLQDGNLTFDGGQQIHLAAGDGNRYRGSLRMEKDGAYHVAATDHGQQVRLSEDYFIATDKANPPEVSIDRPGRDYRASPIEEVTVAVKADDQFGLNNLTLHYSVNGGPEQSVSLLKQPGAKNADGSMVLRLEDYKLVPGDLVSLYATAKDGHSEGRTEITFIQADPFEREFSQSQQMGGGGGGGGQGQGNQTDISRRQKELIAATWKQQNEKSATPKEAADQGNFLADVQSKLRDQVLALSARMQSRDISAANEEFNSFDKDMQAAANAMAPATDKLKQMQWQQAIPIEQKALQYLLRAEATFRQIEVAFGQRGGGGGAGGGAGRDLASLFDLELDTEKNQYETAQSGSPEDQRAKQIDEALQKLDALARRQEELAQQQQNPAQSFEQRWQQEMLRREAEQLQRQLEQMTQNGQQNAGNSSSQSQSSSSSSASSSTSSSSSSSRSSASRSSPSQSRAGGGATDPRVQQALSRLREAGDTMKRNSGQSSQEAARRAADQLRQATDLLSGTQHEQASGKMDSLSREADRLRQEERSQAERIQRLAGNGEEGDGQMAARGEERNKLAGERQQLSDDLSRLEKNMRDAARELAPHQTDASSKLRDALTGMDQSDLTNRVQRSADWLRRGINPNANGIESEISKGLAQLSEQVRQAQQAMGQGNPSRGPSQEQASAALDRVERLRNQLESLQAGRRGAAGQQQDGQQQARSGQQGRAGQPGSGQAGSGRPGFGPGQQFGNNQQVGENGDLSGDLGNSYARGGGATGTVWGNINTGNNRFDRGGRAAPDTSPTPADTERSYQNSLRELNQLRQTVQNDPAAEKEVQELIREMQRLDPKRFPGNPELFEQLHSQVLGEVDRLELQLREQAGPQPSQARIGKPDNVPPGYQDAVADYFRRLSKNQQ